MTQDEVNITTAILVAFGLLILIIVFVTAIDTSETIDKDQVYCESHGGVYLDRTYQVGRSSRHSYTCVKADVIIPLPNG